MFCFNGQPFSSGRANASAKSAALDALAAGLLYGVFQPAASFQWSFVSGAVQEFPGAIGDNLSSRVFRAMGMTLPADEAAAGFANGLPLSVLVFFLARIRT